MDFFIAGNSITRFGGTQSGTLSGITTGQIPIHVADMTCFGFAANIVVECEPTSEAIVQWQQEVFNRLLQTHQRQKANYENAVEALKLAGELDDRALSPGRVRTLIQTELKRQVISLLAPAAIGQSALDFAPGGEPSINVQRLAGRSPEILFFEQAFEWSTLSYILYPHYWGRKSTWAESASSETANPEFDQFIQSGSARVVVAARPAFAEQVQFFLEYGMLWGGGGVPAPNEPAYLSVAEEIMDLQRGPADGELVDTWEIRLPTALTALDPAGTFPLIRP